MLPISKGLCAPFCFRSYSSGDVCAQSHSESPDCARYYAFEVTLVSDHAHSPFAATEKCGKMEVGIMSVRN